METVAENKLDISPLISVGVVMTRLEKFEVKYDSDKEAIGTPAYKGIAYFWNYEYRHYLRDASTSQRKRVHAKFLKLNLDLVGESDEHFDIIKKITKKL